MVSSEDLSLMAAVGRGDEQAQRVLAKRLLSRVKTNVSYLANSSPDTDDLVQVSLLEILRSAKNYRGDSSIETWADRIAARTIARGLLQARRRTTRAEPMAELPDVPDRAEAEGDLGAQLALRRRLVRLVETLPLERRLPVLYKYVYGYSLEEIAAFVQSPVNTVRNRLLQGKAQLRALLVAAEGHES